MPRTGAGGSDKSSRLKDVPLRPDATRARKVPVEQVAPNPRNLREDDLWESDEERDETVVSMQTIGLIQALVVCTRDAFVDTYPEHADQARDATYVVMAGHRRLEAARLAGLAEVRIDVQNDKLPYLDLLMLEENLKRKALNVFQEGEGYRRLLAAGSSRSKVAQMVGKSKSTIVKRVALLELTGDSRQAVLERRIGVDAAYNLVVALDGDLGRFLEAAQVMRDRQVTAADAVNDILARSGSARTHARAEQHADPAATDGPSALADGGQDVTETAPGESSVLAEPVETPADGKTSVPASRSEPVLPEPEQGPTPDPPTAAGKTEPDTASQSASKQAGDPGGGRAQGNAARNQFCEQLVSRNDRLITDPQGLRIATAALVHASSAALNRAHTWMKKAGAADADALTPVSYRDAVLVRGHPPLITQLAYAVALAEDELRASNRSRNWDYRDIAHVQHLIEEGYQPSEWEDQNLTPRVQETTT